MGQNYNQNVGKFSLSYRVSPLKSEKDIEKIKEHLLKKKSKRDYALFVVGINIGLRASDLTSLKVSDVYDIERGICWDSVKVLEIKTGKEREFMLNDSAKGAILLYLSQRRKIDGKEWLFLSQKRCKLHVKSVNRLVRELCKELGIPGRYGSHTLRKTFGYHAYIRNIQRDPGFINTLQVIFNHSSPKTTLIYIDIDKDKINEVYQGLNL